MLSSFATCQPIASAVGEDDACWVLWHSANLTVDVVNDVIGRQTDPWKRGPAGVNAVRHFAWLSFVTAELTSRHLFDVQGTTEAKVLTEIHETFALGCNGTPNECDWDSTADSNNNNQGIEFGQQQFMQDENESERRSSIEAKAIDMLNNPGTLDLRGGCPSRHWSIPQGC
jgi:hypothetical protein